MLCFPAVLFGGAVLPVSTMDVGGRAMSLAVIARWAFEALGHDLGLSGLLANDSSGSGATLLAQYGDTFGHGAAGHSALEPASRSPSSRPPPRSSAAARPSGEPR